MIRVAILGAGIGSQHLDGFRELPEMFDIRTVCDLDLERARGCVLEGENIAVTDDPASVLSDPEIDLVDVALPPHLHLAVSKQVLEAGKHVICEKPMVRSLAEADELIAAEKASGKRVFPVFQYRYGPGTERLRALINAGLAGKPLVATVETHWNRGPDYYAVDWRGTWAGESGGAILGHAIHNHDLICGFMGPIDRVFAMVDTRVNEIEVEDCAAITMRMQNGALATSSVTLGSADEITRMRFVFSDLTVETDTSPYRPASGSWRYIARDPDNQAKVDAITAGFGDARIGYSGYFEAIHAALRGEPGREVTITDGRHSIEFVTAIYQSARSGESVALPLGDDARLYQSWLP